MSDGLQKQLRLERKVQVAADLPVPKSLKAQCCPHLDADWHISDGDEDEYSAA